MIKKLTIGGKIGTPSILKIEIYVSFVVDMLKKLNFKKNAKTLSI